MRQAKKIIAACKDKIKF